MSAELYDPATGIWSLAGSLVNSREYGHTATLLTNGKVLVAGGFPFGTSAELYDPTNGAWMATGSLADYRQSATATLLPDGKVLVAGGYNDGPLASAELYDPASGTWTVTGSLTNARDNHTATLLPNGEVLVAGGFNSTGDAIATAELYDPASGTWSDTQQLEKARGFHTATLLPNGEVLVTGGAETAGTVSPISTTELYDPASNTWATSDKLNAARFLHTATLLFSGKVLVADGYFEKTAELYNVGLGYKRGWQPRIRQLKVDSDDRLVLTGRLFQGVSQASGGSTQDSSSNYPIVQLRSIDSSQVIFAPADPDKDWSDTSFSSLPLEAFPPGAALVTVFTNGIPSDASFLVLAPRLP